MRTLWNMAHQINARHVNKHYIFIGILMLISGFVGALLWLILAMVLHLGVEWLWCFVGYPAVFVGFFGGMLYVYNHEL